MSAIREELACGQRSFWLKEVFLIVGQYYTSFEGKDSVKRVLFTCNKDNSRIHRDMMLVCYKQ
jgi:hypothetical protein